MTEPDTTPTDDAPVATIADVTISFIPKAERSLPRDCFRISSKDSGKASTATLKEMADFWNQLDDLIGFARLEADRDYWRRVERMRAYSAKREWLDADDAAAAKHLMPGDLGDQTEDG